MRHELEDPNGSNTASWLLQQTTSLRRGLLGEVPLEKSTGVHSPRDHHRVLRIRRYVLQGIMFIILQGFGCVIELKLERIIQR